MSLAPPGSVQLYGRKYNLSVLTYRGETITFDPEIRFTFHIEKKLQSIYQFAEITIYNLSPQTETDILKNGKSVILEAGYENGPYGIIFQGPIRQPLRGKEDGVTYFLTLLCIDGDDAINLGIANFVLSNGQTAQKIASQVARSSSVPFDIQIDPNINQQTSQRGKVVFGSPADYLRSIAINNNASFYVNNGTGYISPLVKTPPSVVPELNAKTGMIGMPQQVDYGVQVRCLINPNITIDSWFKLNNQDVIQAQLSFGQLQAVLDMDGIYRVIGITATGDTRGNDWYFDLESFNQGGNVPAMLAAAEQSGI